MRATLCLLLALAAAVAWADPGPGSTPNPVAGHLDRVADDLDDLDDLAAELAAAQAQTEALRARLAGVEDLTAEHQAALDAQAELLARYNRAVADLEAHDRASLALAEDLKRQLDAERSLVAWALPAGVVLVGVVVVEGWFLIHR
jgi:hypothetical protein